MVTICKFLSGGNSSECVFAPKLGANTQNRPPYQKLLATLEVVDQAAGEFLLPTEMLANFEVNGQFATTVSRYLQRNVL